MNIEELPQEFKDAIKPEDARQEAQLAFAKKHPVGMRYKCHALKGHVFFMNAAINVFNRHAQTEPESLEAGGQLFARFESGIAIIEKATEPKPTDIRSRSGFAADLEAERTEIAELYKQGLHYIGNWHTHPERCPLPSEPDIAAGKSAFTESKHELLCFINVIVGDAPWDMPDTIHVSAQGADWREWLEFDSCFQKDVEAELEELDRGRWEGAPTHG